MKSIQELFNFMSRTGNEAIVILFVICYTLFVILIGVGLAWLYSILVDWKLKRKPPYSIQDYVDHTNRNSGFKINKAKQKY